MGCSPSTLKSKRNKINVEPKRKKETDELKSILEEIGVYEDVDTLFFTVCDRIDEVENGWPVQESLKKAFIDLERAINERGKKRHFVSSPKYHRYLRLKNNTTMPKIKGSTSKPSIPSRYIKDTTSQNLSASPRSLGPRSLGSIDVTELNKGVAQQISNVEKENSDLKQQLTSLKNTTQVKDVAHRKLQEEMALIHKERGAIDRWVVDIGEMFNNIVSLKSRDVHIKGITDMVQLPDDADQNTVLQYTHKLMGQIFSILPQYQTLMEVKFKYETVQNKIIKTCENQKVRTNLPRDVDVSDLTEILSNLDKTMSENKENIRALESQLKLSMKASEENTPPSKLQLEEAKEISKRSVENKKYLDELVSRVRDEKDLTRRLEKLKMKLITLKLLRGKEGHTPGISDYEVPDNDSDDNDHEEEEFDPLQVIEKQIKVTDNIIPEMENFLIIAEVGQRITGAVDIMYTFYCSDVLNNSRMIMDEITRPTAVDIFDKYKKKLDDILETLTKNKTDITELERRKTKLEEKAVVLKERNKEVRQLKYEKEKVTRNLIRETGTKLVKDTPEIAAVVDKETKWKVWVEYENLFENQWREAYELEKGLLEKPPRMAIDSLLKLLKEIYKFCQQERERQWQAIKCAIFWADRTDKELDETYAAFLRQLKKLALPSYYHVERHYRESEIPEDIKKELSNNKFDPFIEKCVHLCWFMVLQEPQMWLHWKVRNRDFVNEDNFTTFTFEGRRVDFLVWPAMQLYEKGPLLSKGVVQPIYLD